jgi:hypothetical protein
VSTRVEKRVLVNVPVGVAYNQWTQFEEFPHFMGGVKALDSSVKVSLSGLPKSAACAGNGRPESLSRSRTGRLRGLPRRAQPMPGP